MNVQVISVNMDVRQIDLGLVDILERVREGKRGPRRSRAPAAGPRRNGGKELQRPGRRERALRKGKKR